MNARLRSLVESFRPVKKKPGRHTKLDAALTDQVCQLLGDGMSLKKVARTLDLNPDTLHSWRQNNAGFYHATENARNRARKLGLLRWDRPQEIV